jgi:hypothetical protein
MIREQDALSFDDAAKAVSERSDRVKDPLPQQQFIRWNGFIGGEDQGYIACP